MLAKGFSRSETSMGQVAAVVDAMKGDPFVMDVKVFILYYFLF